MTQPTTTPVQDLDTLRQILFGAETQRLEELTASNQAAATHELRQLEHRMSERLEDLAARLAAHQAETARLQVEHVERVTQMLDQMLAQLGHRLDTLVTETRERLDALQQRASDLERRKLNAADFGGTLSTLGQRFTSDNGQSLFRAG